MAAASILRHLEGSRNVLYLTGAGVSTQSGIPDYRSAGRPVYKPLQHNEFTGSEALRQRYWARSFFGWPRMGGAQPNAAHAALARLEAQGACSHLITQNVDTLHSKAGHKRVLELHGSLFKVECLRCGPAAPPLCRHELQRSMEAANGAWRRALAGRTEIAPDGDVELPPDSYASFATPACAACGGATLKPSVTFFGGTVPPATVAESLRLAAEADAIVVCGSTCSTFSAFRLLRAVAARRRPVVVVKLGAAGSGRGDALATLLVEEEVGSVLQGMADALEGAAGAPAAAQLQQRQQQQHA